MADEAFLPCQIHLRIKIYKVLIHRILYDIHEYIMSHTEPAYQGYIMSH
jgi:hypothetical protein